MKRYCGGCESSLNGWREDFQCTVCKGPCCPACAFEFPGATYCSRCAETRSWGMADGGSARERDGLWARMVLTLGDDW